MRHGGPRRNGLQYLKVVVIISLRLRSSQQPGLSAPAPSLHKHKNWTAAPVTTPPATAGSENRPAHNWCQETFRPVALEGQELPIAAEVNAEQLLQTYPGGQRRFTKTGGQS